MAVPLLGGNCSKEPQPGFWEDKGRKEQEDKVQRHFSSEPCQYSWFRKKNHLVFLLCCSKPCRQQPKNGVQGLKWKKCLSGLHTVVKQAELVGVDSELEFHDAPETSPRTTLRSRYSANLPWEPLKGSCLGGGLAERCPRGSPSQKSWGGGPQSVPRVSPECRQSVSRVSPECPPSVSRSVAVRPLPSEGVAQSVS